MFLLTLSYLQELIYAEILGLGVQRPKSQMFYVLKLKFE